MSQPVPAIPASAVTGAPLVRAIDLWRRIDGRDALAGVTLEIRAGECVSLLGANGAGKTTLLRVIATLAQPTSGRLELFGRPIGGDGSAVRSRVGLIGHQLMLYRDLSVRENLAFFGRLYRVERAGERAAELLGALGLADRAGDAVRTLSRGTAQRAAIARALMHEPELLLADEPFTGLDGASVELVEGLLARMRAEGRSVLLATHDIEQGLRISQRAVVLRAGHVALDQRTERVDAATVRACLAGSSGGAA